MVAVSKEKMKVYGNQLVKEDEKEYFMCQYSVFYGEYENKKKTGQKNLTFPDRDLNPEFLNKFPPTI